MYLSLAPGWYDGDMYRLYAWGWTPDPQKLNRWREMIPGLGVIHYPQTYHLARYGDICFVNSTNDAKRAVVHKDKWRMAILGDERNVTGPSGHYESPRDYMLRLDEARETLEEAGVLTSSAGLAMAGGEFDAAYQLALATFGDYSGQNFRPASYDKAIEGIRNTRGTRFVATIIPVRLNWWPLKYLTLGSFLWQQLFVKPSVRGQLRELMAEPKVTVTAIWCLREGKMGDGHWQGYHGLIDRNDRLTWQGRMVRDLLE